MKRWAAIVTVLILVLQLAIAGVGVSAEPAGAPKPPAAGNGQTNLKQGRITPADRKAAAARAKAAGVQPGVATKGAPKPQAAGTPDYFGPFPNYANSPLPTTSSTSTSVVVGNPLIARAYATDSATPPGTLGPVFVVLPNAKLPAGTLQNFQTWNQATAGASPNPSAGNLFNAYLLRPTGVANQYTVVYDSGTLTVPAATDPVNGNLATFPVAAPVTVNANDVIGFYGEGIPLDTGGANADILSYPAPAAPAVNGVITLGVDPVFPNYSQDRTYSFAATVSTGTTTVSGGIRKFVDSLPGLGAGNANDLGQYIPVGIPDKGAYPGSDYYEIELGQYTEQLHKDLPPTTLRGYRQTNTADTTVSKFSYLGPTIIAQKDVPVRVKFTNKLPTGAGGNLFIPVDTTVMGAGAGPTVGAADYTQNRATLHLHGGNTPWISDGTAHQWITPAGETTAYPQGVSVEDVPDMAQAGCGAPNDGCQTFYYTNQQSARLMFYHDHSYGITRLNVYAGEAAGYVLRDSAEQGLVASGTIPTDELPLIIQDKTFVPSDAQLKAEDPTWDTANWGGMGNLWFPHVYMPNQNPGDISGASAMGRWDYGPWFWPPFTQMVTGEIPNPLYCGGAVSGCTMPWEPPTMPGTPNPSIVPEGFMDTPLVNGTAYPFVQVGPKAYRFRILNASNDRTLNLQLYYAKSNAPMWNADGTLNDANAGEVPMVPAIAGLPGTAGYPKDITDGRDGGVPDTTKAGPQMIQIGTEGGFLPAPVTLPNTPIGYNYNRRDIVVLNVSTKTLMLGPAERADVIVDFSGIPDGSKLILYNDAPAPVPAFDPRYDYYTGNPDLTAMGGAPSTLPGYGPNTRTIMQIQVSSALGTATTAPNLSTLPTALPAAYASSQDKPIVPEKAYDAAFGTSTPADSYVRIQDTSMSFFNGPLPGLTLTSGGSGYTSAPTVAITGGGGKDAAATATLAPAAVASLTLTNGGSGYTSAPTVAITGGGGTGAKATAALAPAAVGSIAVTAQGNGYTSVPAVAITGGGGSGATAVAVVTNRKVTAINVTNGGSGYTSAPTVAITGGGGTGAKATATLAPAAVASLTLTSGGSGYTSAPTVAITGGVGTGAKATATLAPAAVASLTLTNGGSGYTSAPTVAITGGGGTGATATADGVKMDLQPKAIQELFDPDYGRMNATLGVEIKNTNGTNQTTIPYGYAEPITEILKNSDAAAPIGTAADGSQIWKITHNGVDTHAIHFHLFNVQVINRVGWDGAIRPPDPNELGWKDTVRMNPLEDAIVALRPLAQTIPWPLPNSVRAIDPAMPLGATLMGTQGVGGIDPAGNPVAVINQLINFGWEYVWHCHLLGHEENDMMRPMALAVAPVAPTNLAAVLGGTTKSPNVRLTWTDNSINETAFTVQRATNPAGPWVTVGTVAVPLGSANATATGGTVQFTDTTVAKKTAYSYRVIANNVVGFTQKYAAPAVGWPSVSADSSPSGNSNPVTTP